MERIFSKISAKLFFYIGSFFACTIMAFSTGCASGGFKLTREYARWVNSQNIILRIIIYILTSIVFAVTMLIDVVIFNTMDFWQGKVSGGKYEFKEGEKTYQVHHEILPDTKLKQSTIKVLGADQKLIQEIVLSETTAGEIDMLVDGKLRSRVRNITSIPVASIFDQQGSLVQEKVLLLDSDIFKSQQVAAKF